MADIANDGKDGVAADRVDSPSLNMMFIIDNSEGMSWPWHESYESNDDTHTWLDHAVDLAEAAVFRLRSESSKETNPSEVNLGVLLYTQPTNPKTAGRHGTVKSPYIPLSKIDSQGSLGQFNTDKLYASLENVRDFAVGERPLDCAVKEAGRELTLKGGVKEIVVFTPRADETGRTCLDDDGNDIPYRFRSTCENLTEDQRRNGVTEEDLQALVPKDVHVRVVGLLRPGRKYNSSLLDPDLIGAGDAGRVVKILKDVKADVLQARRELHGKLLGVPRKAKEND